MKKIGLLIALSALPLSALADDVTAAAKISTLGYGLDVAIPVTESVDARLGFNTFSKNFNTSTVNGLNTTNYQGTLSLGSFEALADWHPFAGSFRVSGGVMYNNNKFTMAAQPAGGFINVGGVNYPAAGASVNAAVDFNKVAPYLGIGFGSAPKDSGFSFATDLGIMFQGAPRANITTTGLAGPTLAADVARANADLNAKLKNFQYYPVASIGIGYTF